MKMASVVFKSDYLLTMFFILAIVYGEPYSGSGNIFFIFFIVFISLYNTSRYSFHCFRSVGTIFLFCILSYI